MRSTVKKLRSVILFMLALTLVCSLTYVITKTLDPETHLQNLLIADDACVKKALFSPDDDVRTVLVTLIDNEKQAISLALYTLTDKHITEALVDAAKRGVDVQCIVDSGFGGDRWSKVPVLANNRLSIWVHQKDPNARYGALMHNKFFIFADNVLGKSVLWTGSFNATKAASTRNQENVIILDDASLINSYERHFEILKQRAIQISGKKGYVRTVQCERSFISALIERLRSWLYDFFSL